MDKIAKLNRLESILRDIAIRKLPFDLNFWWEKHDCGFAGCAIGYASVDPVFNDLGFKNQIIDLDCLWKGYTPTFQREYGATRTGQYAVQEFFQLTHDEVAFLFWDNSYPESQRKDPLAVADRLREFIIKECELESVLR